jgi:hypothetical protein
VDVEDYPTYHKSLGGLELQRDGRPADPRFEAERRGGSKSDQISVVTDRNAEVG